MTTPIHQDNNTNDPARLITLAIHTYDQAVILKSQLEQAGVQAVLHNVNLSAPMVSSGVRVRIHERDLPLALRVVEGVVRVSPSNIPTILVPVDFSAFALKSCRVAFAHASRVGARVVLLHAFMSERHHFFLPFGSDRYDDGQEQDDKTVQAAAQVQMRDLERSLRAEIEAGTISQAPFSTMVVEGVPEERILEQAQRLKTSLIVMGTHGLSQQERYSLGSVTAEVVDAGRFPILTIPKNIAAGDLKRVTHVAFFSNLAPQDVLSLDAFTRIMPPGAMNISLIPMVGKLSPDLAQKSIQQLLSYCQEHYPEAQFSVVNLKFDADMQEFHNFVESQGVELIVIPDKKRNIFASLFNPSIAHRILYQADIPMLVVPV